jgi:hypothetical protein
MNPVPGQKTFAQHLSLFSVCVPLVMLIMLGAAVPLGRVAGALFLALPALGLASAVFAAIRLRLLGQRPGRSSALLGLAVNLLILAIFASNWLSSSSTR